MVRGSAYGGLWVNRDLREAGDSCSVHRVARMMRENRLEAQVGYKNRHIKRGKPADIAAIHSISV